MKVLHALFLAWVMLCCSTALAEQPAGHPGAEQALARIVLERDFGADLRFHSRDVVTMAENTRVPGLNGLMFMRWRGEDVGTEVTASVQWFEDTALMLSFYRNEKARRGFSLAPIGDTVVWTDRESVFAWTDGAHFVVSLGGAPRPPKEMLEAWLALISSNPVDLAPIPGASP